MSFLLIQQGEIYAPEFQGEQSILVAADKILKIGTVDAHKIFDLQIPCERIDASGCVVVPGFIDPHAHLIGAGGEDGFTSRLPELSFTDIIQAGITTIVGLIGTDTTTRNLSSLYAKTCQLCDEGITAYMYTGGFQLPAQTITSSIKDDLVLIDKVIGAGEIAISDYRWVDPEPHQLAFVVTETMVGGMMSGKAGVTHLHVGEGKNRLALLHQLLDNLDIPPGCLYATHVERTNELLEDAIALARRGAFIDMDTVDDALLDHLRFYCARGGPMEQLSVSSDAHTPGGSPQKLFRQFLACVQDGQFTLGELLPLFTRNPARALKLESKGELREQKDADLLILRKGTYEIVHLIARGKVLMKDGQVVKQSQAEQEIDESH